MTDHLDQWLERLATGPSDRALDQLEAEIWRGISRRRSQARMVRALTPVAAAAVCGALMIGILFGGIGATLAARREGVFLASADLAPSALLERPR